MRLGIFINGLATERDVYTTTRIAVIATNRGHEVWYIDCDDFAYDADEKIRAWATSPPKSKYTSGKTFLADMGGEKARHERITVNDLDVLLLRNNPALETGYRAWAQDVGIIFGRVAMRDGVIVLNDPDALGAALDKMYLQLLPQNVRPQTIITHDRDEIKSFVKDLGGHAVLKPLAGTGKDSVFVVTPSNRANLNQMIEAITRDGYAIAQEYLEASETSSTRMFLMNGDVLRYKGKIAAFQRVRTGDALRANIHVPGATEQVKLTDVHFEIAEAVRPRLVQDGMFLAGLEIVGGKLLDIDVFSPGGLGNAQSFEKVNFSEAVVIALEHKVDYMTSYNRRFDNVDMATL
jgi:glutathione synthase